MAKQLRNQIELAEKEFYLLKKAFQKEVKEIQSINRAIVEICNKRTQKLRQFKEYYISVIESRLYNLFV